MFAVRPTLYQTDVRTPRPAGSEARKKRDQPCGQRSAESAPEIQTFGSIHLDTIKIHSEFAIVMKPLRILHSESSNGWGGQEHRTFKEMLALRERGHTLELVCVPGARLGERLGAEGFTVHTTPMRSGADVSAVAHMRYILKQERFHVLNTHTTRDNLLGRAAPPLPRPPPIAAPHHPAP